MGGKTMGRKGSLEESNLILRTGKKTGDRKKKGGTSKADKSIE